MGASAAETQISIHTPRVGRDGEIGELHGMRFIISIHTPRVGRDFPGIKCESKSMIFQSTRPVWGVTTNKNLDLPNSLFQSTRPVWGVTAMITFFFR